MKVVPETRNDRALAWLRVTLGFLFLVFAQYKILGADFASSGFEHWIRQFLSTGSAYPFMVPVLKGFVLKHTALFSYLVAYGELAIGLSLLMGVLVTPASVCGFFYMLMLLFSSNYPGAHAPIWEYFGASLNHLVPALCFAAFVRGEPARSLSLPSWVQTLQARARLKEKLRERGYATNNVFGK
jgi:uncharacterized membrane protein YphA (DoxX/SURF4 family)